MIKTVFVFTLWLNSMLGDTNLEGFIVNGTLSNITDFPHSIYLEVRVTKKSWMCGSSVLNQLILLTAAHCVYEVKINGGAITARYGNANKQLAHAEFVQKIFVHPDYKKEGVANDIAVLMTSKPLPLTSNVGRVAILDAKHTPYNETGVVAGWGYTEDELLPLKLHHILQNITKHKKCEVMMNKHLPPGILCGGMKESSFYVAQGDSGSALVVQGYIQVGILSYKDLSVGKAIGIYSDVGYFYKWIMEKVMKLYCIYLEEKEKEAEDLTL